MAFLAIISLIYIAVMLGKEDGKWGLLIVLGILVLVSVIVAVVK